MRNPMIRKLLACTILVALLMSMSVGAFAVTSYSKSTTTAQLTSTQTCLDYLDANGIKYSYKGMGDTGRERVTVSYNCDNFESLTVTLLFDPDEDEVDLRIWSIITVTAGRNRTLETIQSLNAEYKYCKFVLDESDSTLQAELDLLIDKDHCGQPIADAFKRMIAVVDHNDVASQIHALE